MLLRLLLLAPLLLVLVVFALANPQPLHVAFWPFEATFDAPASLALLGTLGIGMLLGALMLWFATFGLRHRARRAERARDMLDAELKRLKFRSPSAALPPPE